MDAAVMESPVLQLVYSRGERERRRRRSDGVVDSRETTEREKRFCKKRAYHNEASILICWVDSEV